MKRLLLIIVAICMFAACNKETSYPEVQSTSIKEYIVASSRVEAQTSDPCTGTTFTMDAYAVKESADEEWFPFFSQIKSFEYSEGVEYVIEVKKRVFMILE